MPGVRRPYSEENIAELECLGFIGTLLRVLEEGEHPLGIHWLRERLCELCKQIDGTSLDPTHISVFAGDHYTDVIQRLIALANKKNDRGCRFLEKSAMGIHNGILIVAQPDSDPEFLAHRYRAVRKAYDSVKK